MKLERYKNYFLEKDSLKELTLIDYSKEGMSSFTKKFFVQRKKELGNLKKVMKMSDVMINKKEGSLLFTFFSRSTYPNDAMDSVNPKSLELKKDPDRAYTQQIKVLDFFKWAKTKPKYVSSKQLVMQELKEILEVADIQIWCDCGSFQFQGMNAINTMFNAAIYPETRMPTEGNWKSKHKDDSFLCKHLFTIFNNINFYINPMNSMLNKKLKTL